MSASQVLVVVAQGVEDAGELSRHRDPEGRRAAVAQAQLVARLADAGERAVPRDAVLGLAPRGTRDLGKQQADVSAKSACQRVQLIEWERLGVIGEEYASAVAHRRDVRRKELPTSQLAGPHAPSLTPPLSR